MIITLMHCELCNTKSFVLLDVKGCICHFVKWQMYPFISKGTNHMNKITSTHCHHRHCPTVCQEQSKQPMSIIITWPRNIIPSVVVIYQVTCLTVMLAIMYFRDLIIANASIEHYCVLSDHHVPLFFLWWWRQCLILCHWSASRSWIPRCRLLDSTSYVRWIRLYDLFKHWCWTYLYSS